MSEQALRSSLIRLAHAKPELRPVLLPLLKHGAEKPVRLTPKELARADKGYFDGRPYTIIVRPQATGGYMVAVVWVDTSTLGGTEYVADQSEVPNAVRELNRHLDKFTGQGGPMADRGRLRPGEKLNKLIQWNRELVASGVKLAGDKTAAYYENIAATVTAGRSSDAEGIPDPTIHLQIGAHFFMGELEDLLLLSKRLRDVHRMVETQGHGTVHGDTK